MNKGFLMFSEEDGLTMLKEEPDDLTHLAPTAGDVCIPLADDNPFLTDMFDDFILSDNYCSLLNECNDFPPSTTMSQDDDSSSNDDIIKSSIPLVTSARLKDIVTSRDVTISPFMTQYNDVSNCIDINLSCNDDSSDLMSIDNSYMLSPAVSKSPGSLPSLCSPGDSFNDDSDYQNDIKSSFVPSLQQIQNRRQNGSHINNINESTLIMDTANGDEDYMDEFNMRAPYIPMNDVDDLPLLMSEDLMWGALPEQLTLSHKELKFNANLTPVNPALGTIDVAIASDNAFVKREDDAVVQSALQQLLCDPNSDLKNKNGAKNVNNKSGVDLVDPAAGLGHVVQGGQVQGGPVYGKPNIWNNQKLSSQTPIIISEETILKVNNIKNNNNNINTNKKISTKRPNQLQQGAFMGCKRIRNNENNNNNNTNKHSQLLQQLIAIPLQKCEKSKVKNNLNYLRDSGGPNSQHNQNGRLQHSDSVLMNLLVSGCDDLKPFLDPEDESITAIAGITHPTSQPTIEDPNLIIPVTVTELSTIPTTKQEQLPMHHSSLPDDNKYTMRRIPSGSLIPIPSLLELNQMDYELNAPVGPVLLQGSDILTALDRTIIT